MPKSLLHALTWTVTYNADDDILLVSPQRGPLAAPVDLLVFPGGGFTATRSVWRLRPCRTLFRWDHAGTA